MPQPPRIVHFAAAVTTYRAFRYCQHGRVLDELLRLLVLALLEEVAPAPDGHRALPPIEELARGLTDPEAPVGYDSNVAVREYPVVRKQLDDLCESPVFRGERADRLLGLLRPFDDYFAARAATAPADAGPFRPRLHGLGGM